VFQFTYLLGNLLTDEASISLSRPLIAVVAVVASLTVIAVIGVIVYRYFVCNGKRHEFSPVQVSYAVTLLSAPELEVTRK